MCHKSRSIPNRFVRYGIPLFMYRRPTLCTLHIAVYFLKSLKIAVVWGGGLLGRGGHQHLQIGRMLDIDLISEPPTPPPPRCMYTKCGNLCGQSGRKRFITSWGLRMSHICPCTPCPSPQGYRSKVESRHFAHHCYWDIVHILYPCR
jgi:hypothetical protein